MQQQGTKRKAGESGSTNQKTGSEATKPGEATTKVKKTSAKGDVKDGPGTFYISVRLAVPDFSDDIQTAGFKRALESKAKALEFGWQYCLDHYKSEWQYMKDRPHAEDTKTFRGYCDCEHEHMAHSYQVVVSRWDEVEKNLESKEGCIMSSVEVSASICD